MEEVSELIRRYGLEEDLEYVIIPIRKENGKVKRCFLLKRRFLRIVFPDGHFADYPLARIIEATVRYSELPLSSALPLIEEEQEIKHDENTATDEIR